MPIPLDALIRSLPENLSRDIGKFKPMLTRLANMVSEASGESIEDVIQDFLLNLYVASSKFRGSSRRTTFIVAVMRNQAYSMMRAARRKTAVFPKFTIRDPHSVHVGKSARRPSNTRDRDLMESIVTEGSLNRGTDVDFTHNMYVAQRALCYVNQRWPMGAIGKLISAVDSNPTMNLQPLIERYGMIEA